MNGKKAESVSYEVGSSPATNCYDLKRYDGSKHSSTNDEFYKQFRRNDYGSRRCPVCYPDQQDSESETESESSVESVIHLTKESKDESEIILESEFISVSESKFKSDLESESKLIPELELKSINSVPESTTKSESILTSPESSGSKSEIIFDLINFPSDFDPDDSGLVKIDSDLVVDSGTELIDFNSNSGINLDSDSRSDLNLDSETEINSDSRIISDSSFDSLVKWITDSTEDSDSVSDSESC